MPSSSFPLFCRRRRRFSSAEFRHRCTTSTLSSLSAAPLLFCERAELTSAPPRRSNHRARAVFSISGWAPPWASFTWSDLHSKPNPVTSSRYFSPCDIDHDRLDNLVSTALEQPEQRCHRRCVSPPWPSSSTWCFRHVSELANVPSSISVSS